MKSKRYLSGNFWNNTNRGGSCTIKANNSKKGMHVTQYGLYALVISAFGPYVFPDYGLRVEHILIYSLLILSVLLYLHNGHYITADLFYLSLLTSWFFLFLWLLIVSWFFFRGDYYLIIARAENFFQPVALLIIGNILLMSNKLDQRNLSSLIIKISNLIIVLLCINFALIIINLFVDIEAFLMHFWIGRIDVVEIVAHRAIRMGRYTGIFNQPFEAGMMYSLGLLLWVYNSCKQNMNVNKIIMFAMILIGGIVSVSKVFLFGGIPLAMCYFLIQQNFFSKFTLRITAFVVVFTFISNSLLSNYWSGYRYLMRFFQLDNIEAEGLLWLFSARRFGREDSGLISKVIEIWNESPLYGLGLDYPGAPDSSYFEVFMYGGLIALLLYISVISIMLINAFKYRDKDLNSSYRFVVFMILLVVGAGLGAPTLTMNRFSVLFWLLFCLFIKHLKVYKKQKLVKGAMKTLKAS